MMLECWHHDPTQRPTFRDISLTLQSFLDKAPSQDNVKSNGTAAKPNSYLQPEQPGTVGREAADSERQLSRQTSAVDNTYIDIRID